MKILSRIFSVLLVVAFCASAHAQDKGSGVQYFSSVAAMNAVTPDVATGSERAIVTSASLAPVNYNWNRITGTWVTTSSHDAVSLATGSSTALTLSAQEADLDESVLETNLDINDLKTLTGVAGGATNLGTFTGTTIANNEEIKPALQALETAVEAAVVIPTTQYYDDAAAAAGGIAAGKHYELALSNRYGGVQGTPRRRQ